MTGDTQLRALHAQGLTDARLAERLGLSLSTVKRRRHQYGLASNCVRNALGRLGEELFAEAARQQGLEVIWPASHGAPFDLLVNGLRVDVKTARQTAAGWRFRLPPVRSSFMNSTRTPKDYARDCDLLALIAVDAADDLMFFQLRKPKDGVTNVKFPTEIDLASLNNWNALHWKKRAA